MSELPQIGDWICWLHGGTIRYGSVRYIEKCRHYPYDVRYVTDNGMCEGERSIMEIRKQDLSRVFAEIVEREQEKKK